MFSQITFYKLLMNIILFLNLYNYKFNLNFIYITLAENKEKYISI